MIVVLLAEEQEYSEVNRLTMKICVASEIKTKIGLFDLGDFIWKKKKKSAFLISVQDIQPQETNVKWNILM